MIKLERTSVMNLENAMRGARNAHNSWARMDSTYDENGQFILGPNDLDLALRLRKAGSDHRKFLRQVFVSVDITAPPLLVEGVRHVQSGNHSEFNQHDASDTLPAFFQRRFQH